MAVTVEARAEARGIESDSFRVARKRLGVGGLRVGEQAIVHFPEAAFVRGAGGGHVLLVRQRMKSLDGKIHERVTHSSGVHVIAADLRVRGRRIARAERTLEVRVLHEDHPGLRRTLDLRAFK